MNIHSSRRNQFLKLYVQVKSLSIQRLDTLDVHTKNLEGYISLHL